VVVDGVGELVDCIFVVMVKGGFSGGMIDFVCV